MKEQGCAIGKTQKSANYKNFANTRNCETSLSIDGCKLCH